MIIIKIKGGLGNQLFQYALGESIKNTNNAKVKFDLSWFEKFKERSFKLDKFNTEVNKASFFEILRLRKFERRDGLLKTPLNLLRKKNSQHITELDNQFNFQPKILTIKDNTYLDGNWQSEKYFKNIENIIRKKITLQEEEAGEDFKKMKSKMLTTNSISLHIRRGDYTTEKVQKVLKLLDTDYYKKAIGLISSRVPDPTFFVFSDDMEWVKENLKTNFPTVWVSRDSFKDYEEMILMSYCKHNVTANSTFSWWGAWLNNNPKKIIIAPRDWFNNLEKNTKDLMPEKWIKI